MPKFNIFLYGNSPHTIEAKDEESARANIRDWLGVRGLPAGTFVVRRTPAYEDEMQMIPESNLRNGFSFEYS